MSSALHSDTRGTAAARLALGPVASCVCNRMQVGKLDSDFDFSKDAAAARTNTLPGPYHGACLARLLEPAR
jgi:hypothetical protein